MFDAFPTAHLFSAAYGSISLTVSRRQRNQIRRLKFILLAVLFDARKIQHIFDERRQPAAFLHDETEIIVLLLRFGNFAAFQIFRHEPHGRDGRAQFVRDAGNEIGFHFVELLLAAERAQTRQ